jgi:hypothetical protein
MCQAHRAEHRDVPGNTCELEREGDVRHGRCAAETESDRQEERAAFRESVKSSAIPTEPRSESAHPVAKSCSTLVLTCMSSCIGDEAADVKSSIDPSAPRRVVRSRWVSSYNPPANPCAVVKAFWSADAPADPADEPIAGASSGTMTVAALDPAKSSVAEVKRIARKAARVEKRGKRRAWRSRGIMPKALPTRDRREAAYKARRFSFEPSVTPI